MVAARWRRPSMSARYVKVKTYKNTIGKACINHDCHRSATVTAERIRYGMRLSVAHCIEHALQGGLIERV
jgi:hypothetical protein